MDLRLADKVTVVTGANKGIGFAVTEALVAEGALVVAGSRSTENLDGLDRVIAMPVDLAAPDGPGSLRFLLTDRPGDGRSFDKVTADRRRTLRQGVAHDLVFAPARLSSDS